MADQFKYIKLDENERYEAMLRASRINEGSNPTLKKMLPFVDHPSRIFAVTSKEELIELTQLYEDLLNLGDLGIIIDTFSGTTKLFTWVNNTTKWQEIILGNNSPDHINIDTLNKLSEDNNGNLLFNGSLIQGTSSGSGGIQFKGIFDKFVDIVSLGNAESGWLVSILNDETDGGAQSIYLHDGISWLKLTRKDWVSGSIEPQNKNVLWVDTSDINPVMRWYDGLKWASLGGSGGTSEQTKKIQTFSPNTYYAYNEVIFHDNQLYTAKQSFTTGSVFDVSDWNVLSGDMKKSVYDTDYDGIVDRAEFADVAQMAYETSLVQSWKPNTAYTAGQQLIYLNKIYTVKQSHVSPALFATDKLDLTAAGNHNELWNIDGGEKSLNEFYHLSLKEYQIASRFKDTLGSLSYNSIPVGDMTKNLYDKNSNGIVDKAETLNGLTATIDNLNSLTGIKGNLQDQLNTITKGMVFKGTVANLVEMSLLYPNPMAGDTVIVTADESKDGARTFYTHNGTSWIYLGPFTTEVRDFTINPIDLGGEVTGVLNESKIDSAIMRKADFHEHTNLGLLETYTQSERDLADAVSKRHIHNNKAILDSYSNTNLDITDAISKKHTHSNKAILDYFTEDSFGGLLYKGSTIGTGSGSGMSDLSSFTTNDLKDSFNKRYVTDSEKTNLALLPGIITDQSTFNSTISAINNKIPSDASTTNKLISTSSLTSKLKALKFIDLEDVAKPYVANAFVKVNSAGTKLEYSTSISSLIKIQKITDMNNVEFLSVPSLKFADLSGKMLIDGTLELKAPDMFLTGLKDTPDTYTDATVLVANASLMKYEAKKISDITNSKANVSKNINQGEWTEDTVNNRLVKLVEHGLESKDLIVSFYDINEESVDLKYKTINENEIMVYHNTDEFIKVVINCSQGVVTYGSGGGTSTGTITSTDFIDDARIRLDKTYSSQKISNVLSDYAKIGNVYTQAQCDARYSLKGTEHNHTNINALNSLSLSLDGKLLFNGQSLLTTITPFFYEQHWTSEEHVNLDVILNVATIMSSNGYSSIDSNEFVIKNMKLSVDEATDMNNMLHLVISDGAIIVIDVLIKPEETQKYILGISQNTKIMVEGLFSANYYLNAF